MATSLSSTTAHTRPILQFRANYSISLPDSSWSVIASVKSPSARLIACSSKTRKFSLGSGGYLVKRSLQKRLVIRFATIEEIEAEKSAIENDVSKGRRTLDSTYTFVDSSWSVIASVKSPSARLIACSSKTRKFSLGSGGYLVKRSLQKRLVIRFATIEEIEAEKSAIENDVKSKMEKTIETLRTSFNSIRTGRANTAMLDKIEVEYYGSPVSLKSIAQISTPDGTSLLLQPYDKSSLKAIEKAIVSSDLGVTPSNDGDVIRLSLPPLTSDRRKELTKVVAKQFEEGKVALRNIRRDALKSYDKLEKEKKLSEDNVKDLSSGMQRLIDIYMKKIEELCKQKEKELLKV